MNPSIDGVESLIWRQDSFQDGGHGIILRRKVLPPAEWTRSVCRPAPMQLRLTCSSWSIVHS